MIICERCGTVHNIKYGSGRFCSRSCANKRVYDNDRKREVYDKIRAKLSQDLPTIICPNCLIEFKPRKRTTKCCSQSCSTKYYNKIMAPEKKKKISEMNSNRIIERYKHGDTSIGWQNRPRLESSYPEKYFEIVLTERGIVFDREFRVGRWFIDFALPTKIALEIDGRQHQDAERKLKDAEKDAYLTSIGWIIFRINWMNPKTANGKKYLLDKIDELLNLIGEHEKL